MIAIIIITSSCGWQLGRTANKQNLAKKCTQSTFEKLGRVEANFIIGQTQIECNQKMYVFDIYQLHTYIYVTLIIHKSISIYRDMRMTSCNTPILIVRGAPGVHRL